MRIVVLSDTHIPIAAPCLPKKIINELKNCALCLHAGDLVDVKVIDDISQLVELKAVRGNMDSQEIKKILPEQQILTLEGLKIGLIHGSGSPFNILQRVEKSFSQPLDIYIFGHSHSAYNKAHGKKVFFNPGSPTDKFFAKFNSYGILELKEGRIERKIVKF
ncbi:MAG: metallophosphoesterase family protein [Candidatus Omnitrophica bacterium]|nr:metallophosphoesterase family protein [Candidatus Omnitrophota bacterium]